MITEKKIVQVLDKLTIPSIESFALDIRRTSLESEQESSVRALLDNKNVVGFGVAEKISKKSPTGKLALVFYVKHKLPLKRLPRSHIIPSVLPKAFSGVAEIPTDVVEIGAIKLDKGPFAERNPIQPGNSIGHSSCLAGTLGAIVKRGKTLLLLSNSHVLAASGKARKGAPIIYPAKRDKGKFPDDIIAKLDKHIKFKTGGEYVNFADCAVAKLVKNNKTVIASIRTIGGPTGIVRPKRGMKIIKFGSTTGKTTGLIRDTHFRFALQYPGLGSVGFYNQVLCTRYSEAGDSGSLILDKKLKRAIGLHFASAKGGSVFCPIMPVLRELDVRLILANRTNPANRNIPI